jgi:hypothetical protein
MFLGHDELLDRDARGAGELCFAPRNAAHTLANQSDSEDRLRVSQFDRWALTSSA